MEVFNFSLVDGEEIGRTVAVDKVAAPVVWATEGRRFDCIRRVIGMPRCGGPCGRPRPEVIVDLSQSKRRHRSICDHLVRIEKGYPDSLVEGAIIFAIGSAYKRKVRHRIAVFVTKWTATRSQKSRNQGSCSLEVYGVIPCQG